MVKIANNQLFLEFVAGDVALSAAHMGQRVDAESRVIDRTVLQKNPTTSPDHPPIRTAKHAKSDRGHHLISVQPHQFGIASEVGDLHEVGRVVPAGKNPSQVAVDEAFVARRVHVCSVSECR